MSQQTDFRVLGPLELYVGRSAVPLGGVRQRSVLAMLLLGANEVVSAERLIEGVWGESPPSTATTALHGHVSALRKLLDEGDRLATRAPGYVLRVAAGELDLLRFQRLLAEGRAALEDGDAERAEPLMREALALWRGPALADLVAEPFAGDELRSLEEARQAAVEDVFEAALARGRHREIVAELGNAVRAEPLRERLRAQLMLALYRSGRQADALEVYRDARRVLVDELGLEPGQELRGLERAILAQDPSLEPPRRAKHPALAVPAKRGRRRAVGGGVALAAAIAAAVAVLTGGGSSAGEPAGAVANSVAVIDPSTARIASQVAVGKTPTSVAVGNGAAWVLNADDRTISRIDARTRRLTTFATESTPTDLAVGPGALWVGNGRRVANAQFIGPVATTVSRLDPATRAVRATLRLPRGRGPLSNETAGHIAIGRGAVWVVNPDYTVSHIDPRSGRRVATIRSVTATAIAASGNEVWALGADGGTLSRIDPRTDTIATNVKIAASTTASIAIGAGAVWVTDPYQGTLWRVDPGPQLVERTIPVGVGAAAVAFGDRSVWVANGTSGTVVRVDPSTNRVANTVAIGNAPRGIAVGAGAVWVTVAGGPGAGAVEGQPASGAPLPGASCGRLLYGAEGRPDRVIVSDFPLQGGTRATTGPMADAVAFVLRRHAFRAGRFTVGYRSCDDSTARTGIFDQQTCAANARAYAASPKVIGEVGPYNSGCAVVQIPIANRARPGPLAMVSPTNSDVALTRATPEAPPGQLARLYPTGRRNYARIFPGDDVQAAADAQLVRSLGARSVFVLDDDTDYYAPIALYFRRAAGRLGLRVAGHAAWGPEPSSYRAVAERVAASNARAVFVAGLLDRNGGEVVRALRRRLGARFPIVSADGLLPIATLFASAGTAARGTYVSTDGLAAPALPPAGRAFLASFAPTQPAGVADAAAVYAAQATEVLLRAIARSDGTRASVARELPRVRVTGGLIGSFRFDPRGDVVPAPITVVRARRGGGAATIAGLEGSSVERVITPEPALTR